MVVTPPSMLLVSAMSVAVSAGVGVLLIFMSCYVVGFVPLSAVAVVADAAFVGANIAHKHGRYVAPAAEIVACAAILLNR